MKKDLRKQPDLLDIGFSEDRELQAPLSNSDRRHIKESDVNEFFGGMEKEIPSGN